jgi:hypothetical protein
MRSIFIVVLITFSFIFHDIRSVQNLSFHLIIELEKKKSIIINFIAVDERPGNGRIFLTIYEDTMCKIG